MSVTIGRTLSHFRLQEEIGAGGMGVVYRARDTHLERDVAIKVIRAGALTGTARRRFRKEALALSRLNHPNIATIFDFDSEGGVDFLVMEYVSGSTLQDRLRQGPLEEGEILRLGAQIVEGLAAAHAEGIVHRDLKPANLRILPDGRLKILDFGLAKLLLPAETDAPTETATHAGGVVGTLPYMAPEQVRGEPLSAGWDVYATGAVLYEMATGRRPHPQTEPVPLIDAILHETPHKPRSVRRDLSIGLEQAILKALAKDPRARYGSAQDLLADFQRLEASLPPKAAGRSRRRRVLMIGAVTLAVVALVCTVWIFRPGREASDGAAGTKRIVVLPFENLGHADDEYFAAGMTEELTGRLAAVRGLGIISRTSAFQYDRKGKSAGDIGADFDVDYLLEGTVRWARGAEGASRVRISPQLIRTSDDMHIWGQVYDKIIDDVFEVQSDIAQQVVDQLGLSLLARERKIVSGRPTNNLAAYQAYLQGRYLASQPHFSQDRWAKVIESYDRAVALDSEFALAYAELSRAHARLYYFQHDRSETRKDLARHAAEQALRLAPDSPEIHLALGQYYLWADRDEARALREFAIAARGLPERAEILAARAEVLRMRGRWEESLRDYRQAVELSPRDASYAVEVALTSWWMRRYPEALEASDRAIALAPGQAWPYLAKSFNYWSWKGATKEGRAAIDSVPAEHPWALWAGFWQDMIEGHHRAALERLESSSADWVRLKMWVRPKPLLSAWARERLGEDDLARRDYLSAREMLEAELQDNPDDPRCLSSLGIVQAALGQPVEAIRQGRRAVELLPVSEDAVYGLPYAIDLALIYTSVGDHEAALAQLEGLLAIPSWISPSWLRIDPRWEALGGEPGFQKLLRNAEIGDDPANTHDPDQPLRRSEGDLSPATVQLWADGRSLFISLFNCRSRIMSS